MEGLMTAQRHIKSIAAAAPALLHVVIIGGGIGGLTLAQGLKRSGVSVAVYERDRAITDRVQGYRVHINPTGSLALHECLPARAVGARREKLGLDGRDIDQMAGEELSQRRAECDGAAVVG
jgi:2-polyprenyl-6-methoxyphenol hydroxylase-like FAD-dependent oxidoreductase